MRTELFGSALLWLALPLAVDAQVFQRPADERIELPDFAPQEERESVLPPLEALELAPERARPRPVGTGMLVREIRVEGSSVFGDAELRELVAPFEGRVLFAEDLVALRKTVTRLYTDSGYINSGAVIPPQVARAGVVRITVIEGSLEELVIRGNRQFRDSYLRERILLGADVPLRLAALEERLQLLQRDDRIVALHARLAPGERPGAARLEVDLIERLPVQASIEANNEQPISLGEYAGELYARHTSVLGLGDLLTAESTFSEGLIRVRGSYELPINRFDTTLMPYGEYSDSDFVDRLGDLLQVEADSFTVGLALRQPAFRSDRTTLWLDLRGEYRRSRSFLLNQGFSFVPGPDRGRSELALLRLGMEWIHRTRRNVIAAFSTLTIGLDAPGMTRNSGDLPDSDFVAWLAQLQWASRLPLLGAEFIARTDLQLANDPLLPLEQIGVGGRYAGRGYRENVLVRDQAVIGSLELRVPVLRLPRVELGVSLVPFFDVSRSWDRGRPTLGQQTLASAGIGARLSVGGRIEAELYWGHAFDDVRSLDPDSLQEDGVFFRVRLTAF